MTEFLAVYNELDELLPEKLDRKEMFDFQLFLEGVGEDAAKSFIRVRMRFVEN